MGARTDMGFEHLSFWSPEATEEAADYRPFSVYAGPLFSPLQCEYGSFFDALEQDQGEPAAAAAAAAAGEDGRRPENVEEEEEEEEIEEGERGVLDQEGINMGINGGCKNLLSERNRRRRLNQQLLALRSLVPCISKMDKRSILMDAAAYLQNLHEEIDRLKRELSVQEPSSECSPTSSESILLVQTPEGEEGSPPPGQEASSNHKHQIFELDAEELDDRTFSLKVAFKKGRGAFCQVQRMVESLGLSTTQSWTHETEGQKMLTTCFIQLKRNSTLTSEMLKLQATRAAVNFGFEIDFGD